MLQEGTREGGLLASKGPLLMRTTPRQKDSDGIFHRIVSKLTGIRDGVWTA
jgi:hypothetical protein